MFLQHFRDRVVQGNGKNRDFRDKMYIHHEKTPEKSSFQVQNKLLSAIELYTNTIDGLFSDRADLNRRPLGPEPSALASALLSVNI